MNCAARVERTASPISPQRNSSRKLPEAKLRRLILGKSLTTVWRNLGLALPCDDSQLRVVQLSHSGHCLQVEGPPGTGKPQAIKPNGQWRSRKKYKNNSYNITDS
jgi:hypothetical protein